MSNLQKPIILKTTIALFALLFSFSSVAQVVAIPYTNSFDTPVQMAEWTHYATLGTDDWEVGSPNYAPFNTVQSLPNAWVTSLNSNAALSATRYLQTPDFDLSDVSTPKVLSFYHMNQGAGSTFKLEYSTDAGATWNLLDYAGPTKVNWQSTSGFSTGSAQFVRSAIRLSFIQGNASVRFRFVVSTGTSSARGWIIDNFQITDEYFNVAATQGLVITDLNQYFSNFTVSSTFTFSNEYAQSFSFSNPFYFSTDPVLDAGDPLLGTVNVSTNGSITNWTNTFALPGGLSAGDYYIFYRLDYTNTLAENTEIDNVNYTILRLDSVYNGNTDDFEQGNSTWRKNADASSLTWLLGDPDNWHLEAPHSGQNAWYSGPTPSNTMIPTTIESPFLDLSGSTNNAICFWYRTSTSEFNTSPLTLHLPLTMGTAVQTPAYSSASQYTIPVDHPRRYGWDCFCKDLTDYDNEISTRFRLKASGNIVPMNLNQVAIDDIYIGEAKCDVSIEGELKNRFTPSDWAQDTLFYTLYNSGLQVLPPTETHFYWSADSVYDAGDVLLTTVSEPSLPDTSFVDRFVVITKPDLSTGVHYILFKTDVNNVAVEMREGNNDGFFEIHQDPMVSLPYTNDFETAITGWRHGSSLGHDDWQWSAATGTVMDTCFSGTKAMITNGNGDTVSLHARSHLYSPVFDLGQLSDPVLEFNLNGQFYNDQYVYWPFNMGNVMYSSDGGKEWKILRPQNASFKRMYYRQEFESISGRDLIPTNGTDIIEGELLYGKDVPIFSPQMEYQARCYDDNHHYVIDLKFLQGKKVQFMYVYANEDAPVEGMMLDDFVIREKQKDLMIPTRKRMLAASGDQKINVFFHVKNNENYLSDPTEVRAYCSVDTVLDASDVFVGTRAVDSLRPFQKQVISLYENVPANYGTFHYLILQLDPNNTVSEINEWNNVHIFELSMDTNQLYQYPVSYDFDELYIDGWSWRNDSTGYYHHHSFRTQTVIYDPAVDVANGQWFLDPIDQGGASVNIANYPVFHLESPVYDFSTKDSIELEFDFLCVGGGSWSAKEGGNLSYSVDGGLTWTVMTAAMDPLAQNWYDDPNIYQLNNEPGWFNFYDWAHAVYHADFLGGYSNVRFRFNYKGKARWYSPGRQGFRLDNFSVNATGADLEMQSQTPVYAVVTQPAFQVDYTIYNSGLLDAYNSVTGVYWSDDAVFDAGDPLIHQFPESVVASMSSLNETRSITFPTPVLQLEYYLFFRADDADTFHEVNEADNVSWTKVIFDATQIGLDEYQDVFMTLGQTGDQYVLNGMQHPGEALSLTVLTNLGQAVLKTDVVLDSEGRGVVPIKGLAAGTYLLRVQWNQTEQLIRFYHPGN